MSMHVNPLQMQKRRTVERSRHGTQLEFKDFATTPVKDILVEEMKKSRSLLDKDYTSPKRNRYENKS
jgi:hypothetical protein